MDLGKLLKFLPFILEGIDAAKDIKDAKGADKKAAAITHAVTVGGHVFEGATGHDAINDAALEAFAGHVIDGVFAGKDAIEAGKHLKNDQPVK